MYTCHGDAFKGRAFEKRGRARYKLHNTLCLTYALANNTKLKRDSEAQATTMVVVAEAKARRTRYRNLIPMTREPVSMRIILVEGGNCARLLYFFFYYTTVTALSLFGLSCSVEKISMEISDS